ncbi:hypothetical protein L842_2384 [Mycobacterium intracellulare MIN_052511_1280]|nr:hypothetical protein L842_2384 [Mycobacterium intracellulare MIN_052511_1280]
MQFGQSGLTTREAKGRAIGRGHRISVRPSARRRCGPRAVR